MSGKRQNNDLPYHIRGINSGDGGNWGRNQSKNNDDNDKGVNICNSGSAIKLLTTDLPADALAAVRDMSDDNLVTAERTWEGI